MVTNEQPLHFHPLLPSQQPHPRPHVTNDSNKIQDWEATAPSMISTPACSSRALHSSPQQREPLLSCMNLGKHFPQTTLEPTRYPPRPLRVDRASLEMDRGRITVPCEMHCPFLCS